jgi:hypothetical protein
MVRTMTAPAREGWGWRQRHGGVWRQALSHWGRLARNAGRFTRDQ